MNSTGGGSRRSGGIPAEAGGLHTVQYLPYPTIPQLSPSGAPVLFSMAQLSLSHAFPTRRKILLPHQAEESACRDWHRI
ncbi:TPA: hypothetical protein JDC63_003133 [Salmonella enterica subsp. arizonae]|nr:hypothetical protein [Salmonella enterica subsp. arizonae]